MMSQQVHEPSAYNPYERSQIQSPVQLNLNGTDNKYIERDDEFLKQIRAINDKKNSTMKSFFDENDISNEQCEEIAQYSRLHSQANIFNSNSILSYNTFKKNPNIQHCSCGCKKATGPNLSLFIDEQKISILGPGVILFFFFLKNIKTIVIFMFMVFGLYSLISNLLSPQSINFQNCLDKSNVFEEAICHLNQISTYNLKTSGLMRKIQLWIGAFAAIAWFIGVKFIEFLGNKKNQQIDDLLDSTSDYTIRVQNLPFGDVNETEIIQYLQELWKLSEDDEIKEQESGIQNSQFCKSQSLNLKSIQIIYNIAQCRTLISDLQTLSLKLVKLIDQKNSVQLYNLEEYQGRKKQFGDKFKQIEELRQKFTTSSEFRKKLSTTCALVYFHESEEQTEFLRRFENKKSPNPLTTLCDKKKNYVFKDHEIIFTRAPEPSDFYWPNCEIKFSYIRYTFIWVITVLILYMAYTFVFYVQTIQAIKSSALILVSVFLQIFNRIIWYSLSFFVIFEYHNTKTDEIVSLMKKSIFSQIMNVIVIPMISKFINNKPLYGEDSISINALFYQFVMFFMMVLFYVINPFYYFKLITIKFKCIRNKMIRRYCQVVGEIDTIDEIRPVLVFYQGPPFPIAGAYVYMTTAIIHTLFYCHLQPILLLMLIANMTGFYLIMKYLLLRRCKIPELTDIQAFQIGIMAVSYGALFYGAGSILFIILQKSDNNLMAELSVIELFPSSLCLFLCFLLNINPWNITDRILLKIYEVFGFERQSLRPLQGQISLHGEKQQKIADIFTQIISSAMESLDRNDPLVCQRKQSYYKHSNAHKLFNFQAEIKEIANQQTVKRTHQLQKFCESFCKKKTIHIQQIQGNSALSENQRTLKIQQQLAQIILIPAIQLRKQKRTTVKTATGRVHHISDDDKGTTKTNLVVHKLFSKIADNINMEATILKDESEMKRQNEKNYENINQDNEST